MAQAAGGANGCHFTVRVALSLPSPPPVAVASPQMRDAAGPIDACRRRTSGCKVRCLFCSLTLGHRHEKEHEQSKGA